MDKGGAQRVARYCAETVGEKLRSVSEYDETGVTTVYSRPGLREDYTDEQAAALLETAMEQNQRLHRSNIERAPLGEPRAGIYAFEEAFVVQLPVSETEGIVVTMDADVGTQLGGFVQALRERMIAPSSGPRGD